MCSFSTFQYTINVVADFLWAINAIRFVICIYHNSLPSLPINTTFQHLITSMAPSSSLVFLSDNDFEYAAISFSCDGILLLSVYPIWMLVYSEESIFKYGD
ncbi:hypothetical protein ACH5RR_032220 [Cinchona calisaya]|uniref:Uncharacterized protein n=1 Tax=Cinchona calisaya TaxID=153742 RepID=A0ABD2YMR8_9GENT